MTVRQQRREEQDLAAGGAELRKLRLDDGTVVVASVRVKNLFYQRFGYLQFKAHGKTQNKYIGKVTAPTRAESLIELWNLMRKRKLVEGTGWAWEAKAKKKI